ncbi:2-dehydro-3-deoxy-6-phosphogalactonate aldolase [Pinirhizobacter soli]|uniref:2-dehydro-3-deoxy-6-phosphogalactonate aldolase n=1 Tax=Pinirhizobacter soli TaxID=2786953 RepID=UPI00202A86DA|nr:2-dehydro-3-deoxy-6-phosphogalactonate aldolase [Pinirhizobacter soli]
MIGAWLDPLPLVAILRGITPAEAADVGDVLVEAGFRILEVPLNSPDPLRSIGIMRERFGDRALVGAGTVLSPARVDEVAAAGGKIIVMPHADVAVIRAAKAAGLYCLPGVSTTTEAFAALDAGADALKIFPAELIGPHVLKAWRAVLPKDLALLPVGGIEPGNMAPFVKAGASGFGIGGALYAPGRALSDTSNRAHAFAQAWAALVATEASA